VVWSVGDIHGRMDLLKPLVDAIVADLATLDQRGLVLDFLENPSVGQKWCDYGGDATIRSYGLRVPDLKHKPEAWAHLSADLSHKLSSRQRAFLEDQELSVSVGDYFFVHAGARPGVVLERQAPEDLMWIRRSFLDSAEEFERVIVHGHTPTAEVHADRRRIGIDTKAYESGVLTALRLERTEREILQAVGPKGPAHLDGGPGEAGEIRLQRFRLGQVEQRVFAE